MRLKIKKESVIIFVIINVIQNLDAETLYEDLRDKYGINLETYIDQMDTEYKKNNSDEEYEQISFIGPHMQIINHFDRHAA